MERARGKADFFTSFHQMCAKLLSPQERQILHRSLEAYRTFGNVNDLVSNTYFLWTAPSKLQLLPFVRQVIALPDRQHFDALLGIHEGYVVRGPRSDISKTSSMTSSKSGNHPSGKRGPIHVVKIASAASPCMGFSVRGGSEFGLGIYVSHVDPDSPAEKGGLKCGDQILESNGVELERASSERAVELLSGTHTHTLVVRRTRKIPEWKVTKERILWYDVALRKLVAGPSSEEVTAVKTAGSEVREGLERKVVLRVTRDTDFVGLNIRGGKDFGLGIYISRVDTGGLAQRAGVEVGDQVVQINKQVLDNATHNSVVQLLRSHKHLVLTLRAVGKFPAYKELFTEYVWSDSSDIPDTALQKAHSHTAELHPVPRAAKTGRVTQRTKTRESRIDRSSRDSGIDLNGVDLHQVQLHQPNPDYEDVDLEDEVPVQKELFYPRDQDIIFRGNYSENWRQLDKAYRADDASTTSEHKTSSSATYSGRAVSRADTDSESSEEDMDYTTFLERQARRDEEKAASLSARSHQNLVTEEPVLIKHRRQSANQTQSHTASSAHIIRVDTPPSDGAEPAPFATDSPEPSLIKATDRMECTIVDTTDRAEPTFVKAVDRTEPALMKTVIRVDASKPQARLNETIGTQAQGVYASSDRREDAKRVEVVQKEPSRHDVSSDGDVYAMVKKPARQQQSQTINHGNALPTATISGRRLHSADALSTSSRSSSEHSDDDSNSSVNTSHGRHHRTHIYHVHTSPDTGRRDHPAVPSSKEKPDRRHQPGKTAQDEDKYIVMTEVMDEVAIKPPSPPADYRRISTASSTSNSDSTVTTSEHRERELVEGPTAIDLLTAEIKRLEARQSSIGSREIFSLGEVSAPPPDKTEKEKNSPKPDEEKKVGKWSAIKKRITGSMRIKKGHKRPTIPVKEDTISMGSIRKKGIFERSFGSQMMNQQTEDKYNLMMVEERARQLLRQDECDAVLRHIKTYHEERDLDRLVEVLMVILDRPDKLQLLKDIRGVVLPSHVGRFDSLVAQHEVTSFDNTSSKLHLPLNPVHRSESRISKPRPKFMTTVIDADGHFHIQSVDHEPQDKQQQPVPAVNASSSHVKNRPITITSTNNNSDKYSDRHQEQRQHPFHNAPNNRYSGPSTAWPAQNVNGVAHRNRMNNDFPLAPPPEWRDDVEVIIVEKPPAPPPPTPPPPEEGFVVYLSKQKKNLGLIVCGGAGDHMDSSLRIEMVMPWGAAADDERIQSGMHIVSVDDQPVKGMTQSEAIALLKRCFTDVKSVNMKLRIKHP